MTTTYPSEEAALHAAAYFATGDSSKELTYIGEQEGATMLSAILPEIAEGFGDKPKKTLKIYEIENVNGEMVKFGIGPFRDGYELWLINSDGMMLRT